MKSSSAEAVWVDAPGRFWLAALVARVMNVERGRVTPRVDWIRFWTSSTAFSDILTATLVSTSGAGAFAAEGWVVGADGSAFLGGAILTVLRSRWASFDIRAD